MLPFDDSPPFVTAHEPLAASLHWSRDAERFKLVFLKGSTRKTLFKTEESVTVGNAIERLVIEARAFTDCVSNWTERTPPSRRAADQERLREAGEAVGAALFPGEHASKFIRDLSESGAQFVGVDAVEGHNHVFPWNLIRFAGYDFWLGELACFSLAREGNDGRRQTAKHRDVAGVIAGYADDDQLLSGLPSPTHPEATQSEYKALRKTADGGIETLDDLPPGPMDPLALAKTQEWLATPLHLFHFNAHASDPGHPQGFVQIGLRLGAQLSGEDVVSGAQVTGAIVLDVCNAAHGTRNYWNNCLAASFHRRGVPVVLAAASTVADAFGAEFSEVFYGEVPLNDYMLFQALRATQRILLDRTRHPMALYYVYEGSPSFELGRY
mgnify:CR=1 FL=1